MKDFLKRIGVTAGVLLAVILICTLAIKLLNSGLAYMSESSDVAVLIGVLCVIAGILLAFAGLGAIGLLIARKYFYSKK